ncbi:hypothetical protein [Kitasatospora sp. NPDC057015]
MTAFTQSLPRRERLGGRERRLPWEGRETRICGGASVDIGVSPS